MSKLLQNVNVAGTALFFHILTSDPGLAVPHLSVRDITWVDWPALRAAGFKACVFDKDNTLCEPFAPGVDAALLGALEGARAAFGGRLAIYSNSAGLQQYDPRGEEADALEAAFGIHCLRHRDKKPAGSCGELEAHFGCPASDVIFVGDRYLTDVVYGNRHGMLTVRVAPLTSRGEPPGVRLARRVEEWCVGRWAAAGVKARPHARLPPARALEAVRDPAGARSS
ncbi:MAG: mitochondrial PGP phosphatase-domain-containing protein [Monoraphidium minutum]|nr:MAG: mitochondrial PGP phosphatase-domain-containing protein [Monoraphidium minutum]